MVLIKVRLLIFLVLSRCGLACKYRIISQKSIYNWIQNYIFWYFWYCIFIFKIKLQPIAYLNLLRQVRWFVTWWVESSIISSDSNLTQNIIRETIKAEKKEMDKDRILTHSRTLVLLTCTFRQLIVNKKKHLTINNTKLNFVKKTSSMLYPVKRHLKYQEI